MGTPGIDINATEPQSWMTTVHATAPHLYHDGQTENHEGLALLLARPDLRAVNQPDINGWTPVWIAVKEGALECVQLLLNDPRVDPNIPSTPPARAFPDPRIPDSEVDLTPLMYAVKRSTDASSLVPLLLANPRVNLNIKDRHDWDSTPLMHAVKENKRELVELLLVDPRSDLNTRDSYQRRKEDWAR